MQLVNAWLNLTFVSAEVFRTAVNSNRKIKKKALSNEKPLWLINCTIPCHSNNIVNG